MRNLILILVLIISVQNGAAQACGIYRINYVGEIVTETTSIKNIKLPSVMYLHNLEQESSELAFIETKLINGKIDVQTKSHLTSHLYSKAQILKDFYKSKWNGILITLVMENNGVVTRKQMEIDWEKIDIKIVDDDGFGNLFQIDLGKVVWK